MVKLVDGLADRLNIPANKSCFIQLYVDVGVFSHQYILYRVCLIIGNEIELKHCNHRKNVLNKIDKWREYLERLNID